MTSPAKKPCGLYRTLAEVGPIPAAHLVYFHNHSDEGHPIVLMPTENHGNRWSFSKKGYLIANQRELDQLARLKPEGIYRLRGRFRTDGGLEVAESSLLQLGYDRRAEPIAFFPRFDRSANALVFPARGVKLPNAVYELLDPLSTAGPRRPRQLH